MVKPSAFFLMVMMLTIAIVIVLMHVFMTVVVMVVMAAVVDLFHMALGLVAMLLRAFQLQGGVADAVLLQFVPHLMLNFVPIVGGNHMHRGIIVVAIQAPYMHVVHI